ncbi:DedA family protein [Salipaludibacillus sp. CF4.18]|uniref:DedA family protein n=1 Tax=Salipaludibacillus sp. CF4.18 TaxID=3373081 RepID=UPI003EE5D026
MENWITDIMSQYGYIGIFLLIMLENIFPPIPSEVILTFGGYMTTQSEMTAMGVIMISTAGSVTGAIILYGVGLLMDVTRLEKVVDRYGYVLRLKRKDLYKADAWFDKYGIWTVLFCRLLPLIRSLISIPAGMSNMRFGLFLLFTTLGTLIWNTVLVLVGESVGDNWESIVGVMSVYANIAYVLFALLGLAMIMWYLQFRKRRA